jgi:GxxExxY protein
MIENEIATKLVNIFFKVHKSCGPGLYEHIYESIICYELDKANIRYKRQAPINVIYDQQKFNIAFKADLIVEEKVIVELKSVEHVLPVHSKQLLSYLRLTDLKLGLLVNFNECLIKDGISRVVNNLEPSRL